MATPGKTFDADAYKRATANVKAFTEAQKKSNKSLEAQKGLIDDISTKILGLGGSEWFKKVPKTTADITHQANVLSGMKSELSEMEKQMNRISLDGITTEGQAVASKLADSFKGSGDIIAESFAGAGKDSGVLMKFQKELTAEIDKQVKGEMLSQEVKNKMVKSYEDLGISLTEIDSLEEQILKSNTDSKVLYDEVLQKNQQLERITDERLKKTLALAIGEQDIAKFLKEEGEAGKIALAQAQMLDGELGNVVQEHSKLNKEADEYVETTKDANKEVRSMQKGLMGVVKNLKGDILKAMTGFDNAINSAQQKFGINMDDNQVRMSNLVVSTAEFGMSIEDTTGFMGALSDEIRSTDNGALANATKDLMSIEKATGLASEHTAKFAGEMMRSGSSSKDVYNAMSKANVVAKQFGVNTRKVLEGVAQNLDKMRTMGFTGGVESLTRMVAQAERLKVSVDEVFNMSSKARNLEGAMKMAAELQLAGGSFNQINPMELLAAARKGPEEMMDILTEMGDDVGDFNEKGVFEFDPVDHDRLKIMADATGMSLESMTDMIRSKAEAHKKLELFPTSMFSIDGQDSDAVKTMMSDAIEIGENGELEIKEGNMFGASSIAELQSMSSDDIASKIEEKKIKDNQLKEQAKQNMSLADSLTAFKNVLINAFTIFQPFIKGLTWALQGITSILTAFPGASLIAALVLFAAVAVPKLIAGLAASAGKMAFMFSKQNIGSIFKAGSLKNAMSLKAGAANTGSATDSVTKSSSAVPKGKSGLETLSDGFKKMGRKNVLKGIGNTALAGPALLLLLLGMPTLLLMMGVGAVAPLILAGFGAIAGGFKILSKAQKNIIKGSIAMAIAGASLIPFGIAMLIFSQVDWGAAIIGIIAAGVVVMGLMGLGFLLAGPQLIALAIGVGALAAVGLALLPFAISMALLGSAFQNFTTVDWSILPVAASSMLAMIPALLGLAVAGLLFVNPITLLGMMAMIGVLGMIAAVMVPLGESLDQGASALDSMATGVMKLNESLGKLDFDKLEQLKEISAGFANASGNGDALASALEKFATSMGGNKGDGSEGSGGVKTVIVQMKMPNGRVMQEHIIDDVNKVS